MDVRADEDRIFESVAYSPLAMVLSNPRRPDNPLEFVNSAFCGLTGYPEGDILGRNCRFLQGPDTDPDVVAGIGAALRAGVEHRCVVRNHRRDGSAWWNELQLSPVRDDTGRLTHYLGFQHDVSDRVEAERLLAHHAAHDALTGLANRATLTTRLDVAVDRAQRTQRAVAVLFCDLDGFKPVNDRHGHRVGDDVLVAVADRLRQSMRVGDELARIGGDEFTVLLRNVPDAAAANQVAERLLAAFQAPFEVPGGTEPVGLSVGVALAGAGATADGLLAAADAALYACKRAGGGRAAVVG